MFNPFLYYTPFPILVVTSLLMMIAGYIVGDKFIKYSYTPMNDLFKLFLISATFGQIMNYTFYLLN